MLHATRVKRGDLPEYPIVLDDDELPTTPTNKVSPPSPDIISNYIREEENGRVPDTPPNTPEKGRELQPCRLFTEEDMEDDSNYSGPLTQDEVGDYLSFPPLCDTAAQDFDVDCDLCEEYASLKDFINAHHTNLINSDLDAEYIYPTWDQETYKDECFFKFCTNGRYYFIAKHTLDRTRIAHSQILKSGEYNLRVKPTSIELHFGITKGVVTQDNWTEKEKLDSDYGDGQ